MQASKLYLHVSLQNKYIEAKQMSNSTNLARKIEHAQFTVQDYPARLHAGYCTTLQRVGYLVSCVQYCIV